MVVTVVMVEMLSSVLDKSANTLSCLRYKQVYKAGHGAKGGPNGRTGRCGVHCEIAVPLGTEVYCKETGQKITEIINPEDTYIVAKGVSGLGNKAFITSTRQVRGFLPRVKKVR